MTIGAAAVGSAPSRATTTRADSVQRVILHGDNLPLLRELEGESVQMVYTDPPFNTGRTQTRRTLATVASADGDRDGFGGRRYASQMLRRSSYRDAFED